MEFTSEEIKQIEQDVVAAMQNQGDVLPAGISADSLCKNKALILGFLETLGGFIPSPFGKAAARGIMIAANAWFNNKGC